MKKNFRKGKKKDLAVWKLYFKEQLLWELEEENNLTSSLTQQKEKAAKPSIFKG